MRQPPLIMVGDFETTVYENQTSTEVWASALVTLNTEDVKIFHSINATLDYLLALHKSCTIYYHNLKFDGAFWLSMLLENPKWKQAYTVKSQEPYVAEWLDVKDMPSYSYQYMISDKGQWYNIILKTPYGTIQLCDSLKLLPFTVKAIGEAFKTKHRKTTIEYTGYRYANCEITDEEKEYIANDVLVVKEALEIMFAQKHNKKTIGSCCLAEFKHIHYYDWDTLFPRLDEYPINYDLYGSHNADEYIRKSYRGGWCYLAKGKENKIKENGLTLDVNSLYPSVMSGASGNLYPTGLPTFWQGNIPPLRENQYYFVRIRCRFKIKEGYLPFIQKKSTYLYNQTEMLETSDVYDKATGKYCRYYRDLDGTIKDSAMEMTMTCTDYKLFLEHYDVDSLEVLDGCYFTALPASVLFDFYIDKYKKIKLENKGALRTIAKLFLNNLYGKLATNDNSSYKIAYLNKDGAIAYRTVVEHNKAVVYVPCGSAVTSYARNFTIRTAQANYYGPDKRGFIYADTDSIHCDLDISEVKNVRLDDKEFLCWKCESQWDKAIFVRQKTYLEHVIKEDFEDVEPYYDVKCAGMSDRCKQYFIDGINNNEYTLEDFKIGLQLNGKLIQKRIKGGVILEETTYEMR